jgi:diguanylate cyclase (GGDEF)-like protein
MTGLRGWLLWQLPRPALVFVLGINGAAAFAFATTVGQARDVTWLQVAFALMTFGALLNCQAAERRWGKAQDTTDSTSSQQIGWIVPLGIICPPWLAVAAVITAELYECARPWLGQETRRPHPVKNLFNASLWAVTATAVHAVSAATAAHGPWLAIGLSAVATSALVLGLLGVLLACVTDMPPRQIAASQVNDLKDTSTVICLGALVAAAWAASPPVAVLAFPLFSSLQRSLLYRSLLDRAQTDAKTGLANAEFWRQTAEAHITRSTTGGPALSLMVVDLDHFKKVNDTYGHLAGDDVLKEVAVRLKAAVRPGDMVGRFGGEEFTVLLPGAGPEDAVTVAERCREAIRSAPVPTAGGTGPALEVRCSVGVASVLQGQDTALADVMEAADQAPYRATATGRDRVVTAGMLTADARAGTDGAAA